MADYSTEELEKIADKFRSDTSGIRGIKDFTSPEELYDELNGFAFSGKKCVILTDYDIDDCSKDDFEKLLSLAGDSYESSVFIIYFDALTCYCGSQS